jgi:hypothetical protein
MIMRTLHEGAKLISADDNTLDSTLSAAVRLDLVPDMNANIVYKNCLHCYATMLFTKTID